MGWQRVRHDRETNTFAFSCCGDQALGHTGFCSCKCGLSGCSSQPLQHRLSSCGTQAWLLHGMWNHHRPKIEAISCIGRQILYHWASREALICTLDITAIGGYCWHWKGSGGVWWRGGLKDVWRHAVCLGAGPPCTVKACVPSSTVFIRPARYSRRNKLVNNHLSLVSSYQFARSTDICKTHWIFQEHNFHVCFSPREDGTVFHQGGGSVTRSFSPFYRLLSLTPTTLTGLHFQIASLHLFSFFRSCVHPWEEPANYPRCSPGQFLLHIYI